jgi:outer membrane protein assembly factor BamB
MKKKALAFSAIGIAIVLAVSLIVFTGCQSGTKDIDPVSKIFTGGLVISGSKPQLFAKIYVSVTLKDTPYKSSIEGIPEKLLQTTNNNTRTDGYEIDFNVNPPSGTEGEYPYKIMVKSDKDSFEFEGVLVVGTPTNSDDLVGGDSGKTGYLTRDDFGGLSVSSKVAFTKMIVANPIVIGQTCVVGLSSGELVGIDPNGKELWKAEITKNVIETLQRVGNNVLVAENTGKLSIYDIEKLSGGNSRASDSYTASGTFVAPPTVLDDSKIAIGTTDGKVICLSIPGLDYLWEYKCGGAVIGSIAAVPLGKGNGNLYFNSQDKFTHVIGFDGKFGIMFKHDVMPVGFPIASSDKFAVLSQVNSIQLRQNTGNPIWQSFSEFDVTGNPVFDESQVFVYGKKYLSAYSLLDGSENWTIELPAPINSNPVIFGNDLLVGTEDKNIRVIRINDGLVTNSFQIEGSIAHWPYYSSGRLYITDRRGFLYILSKSQTKLEKRFDMSQVLSNGGKIRPDHNCIVNVTLPVKPKLIWQKKGSFAPALTTKDKVFLYDIDEKRFSCHDAITGTQTWSLDAEATDGMFYGFFFDQGAQETPMCFTEKGLLLGTKSGIVTVDPYTGKELSRSILSGIPQSDGKFVLLTNKNEFIVTDMNLKKLWNRKGEYLSSNVLIDGDYIFSVRRGEGVGEFNIFEAKSGKMIFSHKDTLFDISAAKLHATKRYIIMSTMQGPWVYDKEKALIKGTSGEIVLTNIILQETNFVSNKLYCASNEFALVFDLEKGSGTLVNPSDYEKQNVIFTGGGWIYTPQSYVCMGFETPKKNTPTETDPLTFNRKLVIRKLDGTMISSILIPPTKVSAYGIALGESTIILSEIGEGASLKVYGP